MNFETNSGEIGKTGIWIDWIQLKTYREALVCGNDNSAEDAFKGLNLSSLDPTIDQYDPITAGSLLIREGDVHSPLRDLENSTRKCLRHDDSRSLSLPKAQAQAGGLRQAQPSLQFCTFLYDEKNTIRWTNQKLTRPVVTN